MTISNKAILFWISFFPTAKSTLSFGGEGSENEITPEARDALNELIEHGYAQASEPTCSTPGREYYRGTELDLTGLWKERSGGDPFSFAQDNDYKYFRRK